MLMRPLELDDSSWPVIVMHVPRGAHSDEAIQAILTRYKQLVLEHREPFVMINDLREASGVTQKQRAEMSSFLENELEVASYCRGAAMVFNSAMLRGMLTAILWVSRPPYPTRVFKTVEEARTWANGQIELARPMLKQA